MLKKYPIDIILPELKEALTTAGSSVLHAPAGAGKTTRVPLFLLDLVPQKKGRIVMLEPRRIAAVSAARWMAHTLGEDVGQTVGYTIRFDSRVSKNTRIEVVTEGIFLRRIQTDPALEEVAMVIFDEFHERSLNTDLALALCLDVQQGLRDSLGVLVMSATLDCGPVSSLLGGVPVISSEGKAFPVEERYVVEKNDVPFAQRIFNAVRKALNETSGDILVFLPGAGEIRSCSDALRTVPALSAKGITLHPLYGDLSFEEQERAILPSEGRKIVLATNIAETSLTIEGVQVVIDSGLTRRLQFDPSSGMNRLITLGVSRASAEQRKGRAGRLAPGVCYRLYSRSVFQALPPFAPPEILLSDLSSVVLELAAWGVKDASSLRWLDHPPEAAWKSGQGLLQELGAIDGSGAITASGKVMAGLPLHPRLARLMQRASELGSADLGADLAALLSEKDILRSSRHQQMDYAKEADLADRLDILRQWRNTGEAPSCAEPWSLRGVERTSKQLLKLISRKSRAGADYSSETEKMISRLMLCAFSDRIGVLRQEGEGRFLMSQGRGVRLSPASRLIKSRFIVAANVDAGDKADGFVRLAVPVDEETIRQECRTRIETLRRIRWDHREKRVSAAVEERIGALPLSSKPFHPTDEEVAPILCEVVRTGASGILDFNKEVRQLQGRVALVKMTFPEENWPDLSDSHLTSVPEDWLVPCLKGIRTLQGLSALNILPALRDCLSRQQQSRLDQRAPASIVVPSGSRIAIDYASGDVPLLAVKLQEMFGLSDTPEIAGGRTRLLLHLLSPARRPVQITQDLKGFWNNGYHQVKKELKGRYPKHPWPDDPWNATPTKRVKPRGQ